MYVCVPLSPPDRVRTHPQTMGGCCAFHAGKVFLVATFDEKKNHSAVGCAAVLSDLAKYLRDSMA